MQKSAWIKLSKGAPDWNPAAHFTNARTTPEVWKLLTKDHAAYPNLNSRRRWTRSGATWRWRTFCIGIARLGKCSRWSISPPGAR